MKRLFMLLALQLVFSLAVADVIHVAPPTGDPLVDVVSIQTAIDAASPGDIVQFDQGTYSLESDPAPHFVIFEDDITLQGRDNHGGGQSRTILQGVAQWGDPFAPTFLLEGARTKVRKLTFDGIGATLSIIRWGTEPTGHVIEHCTFSNGHLPILTWSFTDDVIHIRHNKFVNTQVAFEAIGKTVHFRSNLVTSPDPESMLDGKPYAVGFIYSNWAPYLLCENNVFANNTIIGNADGFIFMSFPGEMCTNNLVLENTFIDQRVWFPFDLGSMVIMAANGGEMAGNMIVGNKMKGSQGVGIAAFENAHDNYISDNKFEDFVPGDVLPDLLDWLGLPLTGIFLDFDSSENHVLENLFKNVPNPIQDLGTDNVIEGNVNK